MRRTIDHVLTYTSFLAERIVSLNGFGCPPTSYDAAFKQHGRAENEKATHSGSGDRAGAEKDYKTSGVWLLASHINHSCCENAKRSFIGDALILRAAKDLAAGDELTFAYIGADDDDDKRAELNKRLREQWGFECRCAFCAEAGKTPAAASKNRRALLDDIRATVGAVVVSTDRAGDNTGSGSGGRDAAVRQQIWLGLLAKAEQLAKSLAQSYTSTMATASGSREATKPAGRGGGVVATPAAPQAPRLHLAVALAQLSMAWCGLAAVTPAGPERQRHAAKSVAAALESLRALGFVLRVADIARGSGNGGVGDKPKAESRQRAGSVHGQSAGPTKAPAAGRAAETTAATAATATTKPGGGPDAAADAPPQQHAEPALVVEKWGFLQHDAFRIWEQLARAYEIAGAPAALVNAAVEYLRTAYRIEIGEDEATFDTVYAQWARTV
jgi:hypothetical protein